MVTEVVIAFICNGRGSPCARNHDPEGAPNLMRPGRGITFAVLAITAGLLAAGCSAASATSAGSGTIVAVGAESEYANVISQIGGKYVQVTAIESNPSTDPHAFEASPSVAQEVSSAQLVVQNGIGYDTYMNRIESASPSSSRKVIVVQNLFGL